MRHRRHEAVVIACTIAALAGFVACGDDDLTVETADVVGTWTGTTSQQRALGFTVSDGGVADGVFDYQMTGQCNFMSSHALISSEAIAISGGRFTTGKTQIGTSASGAVFITVSGEFTSSTTAKGNFLIQHAPCSDTLDITWTATKN